MKTLIATLLVAVPLLAQPPKMFFAAGATRHPSSGITSFGYRIGESNTFSYTTHQFSLIGSSVVSSLRTGIATELVVLGPVRLWTLADAGIASPASGGVLGGFSGGAVVIWKIPKTSTLHLAVDVRIVKQGVVSKPYVALLFGKSF